MTPFAGFVALCRALEGVSGRLEKRRRAAEFLARLTSDEIAIGVTFLQGRAFPVSDPRVLNVRGSIVDVGGPEMAPHTPQRSHVTGEAGAVLDHAPLTLMDVAAAFAEVADARGPGSRRRREERLIALASRATPDEREILHRIVTGEMRTGVSDGLVLEAIAALVGGDLVATRRGAQFLGDLAVVASLVATGGAAALAAVTPRPFVPLLPMLAEIATGVVDALTAHGGRTALEYKYDGARIQLHKDGDRVQIWSRRLSDVTRSLPDVVAIARRDLTPGPLILDGEVVALDRGGRPLPFQELMRRFRRVHDVESLAGEIPLALHFFDCLMADGRALIDAPYAERWDALSATTGGRYLAERAIVLSAADGEAFMAAALGSGHEGLMAKDLASTYEPGGRGKRWFKLKSAATVDCVIIAVDRGSGRRVGWLSNYHLAVRDGDGFADVGKTFKGLTDAEFVAMTERLRALATADDGYTVRVRPEVVVEVEYNEIQKSPTYPSGLALRFARIARIREDKAPEQASTLEEMRQLYERQFETKGRID